MESDTKAKGQVVGIWPGLENLHTTEPQPDVVDALEQALEQAQAGEIMGVCIVKLHRDRFSSYDTAGICKHYGMIGGMEVAKNYLARVITDGDDV